MEKIYKLIEELFEEKSIEIEEEEDEEESLEIDVRVNLYILVKKAITEAIPTKRQAYQFVKLYYQDLIGDLIAIKRRIDELEKLVIVEESADKEAKIEDILALKKVFFSKIFKLPSHLQDPLLHIIHHEIYVKPQLSELEKVFGQKTYERLAKLLKSYNYDHNSIPTWLLSEALHTNRQRAEKIKQLLGKYIDLFKLYYL